MNSPLDSMFDSIKTLNIWYTYCRRMAIIHDRMRAIMRFRNYSLYISALLLSTIASSATISLGVQDNKCDKSAEWVKIFFGSMGLASVAMFSIHRYLMLPEFQREYDLYSDEFEKLRLDISMHIALHNNAENSETYRNYSECLKDIKRRMDLIIDKGPPFFERVAHSVDKLLILQNVQNV